MNNKVQYKYFILHLTYTNTGLLNNSKNSSIKDLFHQANGEMQIASSVIGSTATIAIFVRSAIKKSTLMWGL